MAKFSLKPIKVLVAAVIACLIFCLYLAYKHADMIHTRNIHTSMAGPIVKINELRGPFRSKVNQSFDIPFDTQEALSNDLIITPQPSLSILETNSIEIFHTTESSNVDNHPISTNINDRHEDDSATKKDNNPNLKDILIHTEGIHPKESSISISSDYSHKFQLNSEKKYSSLKFTYKIGDNLNNILYDDGVALKTKLQNNIRKLHRIMRTGVDCAYKTNIEDSLISSNYLPILSSPYELLQQLVYANSYATMIEISNLEPDKTVAQYISEKHYLGGAEFDIKLNKPIESSVNTEMSFLLFSSKLATDNLNIIKNSCPVPLVPNLLVTTSNPNNLIGVFDCIQFIQDINILIYDQLPFEFEIAFGKILCRCNETLIEKSLPDDSFFSYWDSVESLVNAAVATQQSSIPECSIKINQEYRGNNIASPSTQYRSFGTLLRSSKYLLISRSNISHSVSENIALGELAKLEFDIPSKKHLFESLTKLDMVDSNREKPDFILIDGKIVSKNNKIDVKTSKLKHKSLINYFESHTTDEIPKNQSQNSSQTNEPYARYLSYLYKKASNSSSTNSYKRRKLMAAGNPNIFRRKVVDKNDLSVRNLKGSWFVNESTKDHLEINDPFESIKSFNFSTDSPKRNRNFAWVNTVSRLRQYALRMREEESYFQWIEMLNAENLIESIGNSNLIYVFGHKISSFSIKLSQIQSKSSSPRGMSVSIMTDMLSVPSHEQMLDIMDIKNNFVCFSELNLFQVSSFMDESFDMSDYSFIQLDVFIRMVLISISSSKDDTKTTEIFEDAIASLISLSLNSYIELPTSPGLKSLISSYFGSDGSSAFLNKYKDINEILQAAFNRIDGSSIYNKLGLNSDDEISIDFYPVNLQSVASNSQIYKISIQKSNSQQIFKKLSDGIINLHSLLILSPVPSYRRRLFKLFLDFPIWKLYQNNKGCDLSAFKLKDLYLEFPISIQYLNEKYFEYDIHIFPYILFHKFSCKNKEYYLGSKSGWNEVKADRQSARIIWKALKSILNNNKEDLSNGKFSLIEYQSGLGHLSALIARDYPEATIISLESSEIAVDYHTDMVLQMNISNNAVCRLPKDSELSSIIQNLYDSPELFRYQLFIKDTFQYFSQSLNLEEWGKDVGLMLSSAVSSFFSIPDDRHISLAMSIFYGSYNAQFVDIVEGNGNVAYRSFYGYLNNYIAEVDTSLHPLNDFKSIDKEILFGYSRSKVGDITEVKCVNLVLPLSYPLIRCDMVNVTRHVHHHYDYSKDGHTRTYTMRVHENISLHEEISSNHLDYPLDLPLGNHPNNKSFVSVHLYRDKDSYAIPYTSIYGVTLITVIRLGLDPKLRDKYFGSFLNLSLYEDMAPWNIVLNGGKLAYIDYDTRDIVFDKEVSKAYQLLTVLMNYKRTVEDFKKCGSKASTVYNLPYFSDCIASDIGRKLTCNDLKMPVPCGDGTCHSDYISCLRSLSQQFEFLSTSDIKIPSVKPDNLFKEDLVNSKHYKFNDRGIFVN